MLFSLYTIHEDSNYRIKDREKAQAVHKLCISSQNSRKMITDNLGLRPITVSKIVKDLIEDRLALEGGSKERNIFNLFPVMLIRIMKHAVFISSINNMFFKDDVLYFREMFKAV